MSDTPATGANSGGVASRFVSSKSLEEAKERRAAEWKAAYERLGQEAPPPPEDDNYDPRSLFERLQENKNKKQEQFDEQMKFKNQFRALDEEEISFLDSLVDDNVEEELARKRAQEEEIRAFREAVLKRDAAQQPGSAPPAALTMPAAASASPPGAGASTSKPTAKPTKVAPPKKKQDFQKSALLKGVGIKKKTPGAAAAAALKAKAAASSSPPGPNATATSSASAGVKRKEADEKAEGAAASRDVEKKAKLDDAEKR